MDICVYLHIHICTHMRVHRCASFSCLLLGVDLKVYTRNSYEKRLQQFHLFSLLCFPRNNDDDDDKNKEQKIGTCFLSVDIAKIFLI